MNETKKYIIYAFAIYGAIAIIYLIVQNFKIYTSPLTGQKVNKKGLTIDTYLKEQGALEATA